MTEEPRVVFATSFESLFNKEARARLTPAFIGVLKNVGVDLQKPFQAGYPVETWAKVTLLCTKEFFPEAQEHEAWFELGRLTIRGFTDTLVGKAMFKLLTIIGPARTLERAMKSYAASSNYTKIELKRLGPTEFELAMNEKHTPPHFDMGVIQQALEVLGVQPTMRVLTQHSEGFAFHIKW